MDFIVFLRVFPWILSSSASSMSVHRLRRTRLLVIRGTFYRIFRSTHVRVLQTRWHCHHHLRLEVNLNSHRDEVYLLGFFFNLLPHFIVGDFTEFLDVVPFWVKDFITLYFFVFYLTTRTCNLSSVLGTRTSKSHLGCRYVYLD